MVSAKYTNIVFTKCYLTVLTICQFRDKALEIARIKKTRKVQVKMIRRLSNTFLMEVFSSITIIADFLYHWVVIVVDGIAKWPWPFLRTKNSNSISNFQILFFSRFPILRLKSLRFPSIDAELTLRPLFREKLIFGD